MVDPLSLVIAGAGACAAALAGGAWWRTRTALRRQIEQIEAEFALTEEVADSGHWKDLYDRRISVWSPGVYRILGIDPKTYTPNPDTVIELFAPEDRPLVSAEFKAIRDSGGHGQLEARMVRADGELRHVTMSVRCRLDSQKRFLGFFGALTDVTRLRRAERAVADREEEAQQRLAAARAAIWDWDLETDKIYMSERFGEIIGVPIQPWEQCRALHDRLCNAEDKPRLRAALETHIKHGAPFEVEYRLMHARGHEVWVQSRGRTVAFRNGKPVRIVGSLTDVNQRREIDMALAEKQELLQLAVDASQAGFFEHRFETGELYWSPRLREILGLSSDVVPRMDYMGERIYPEDLPDYLALIHRFAATGDPLDMEVRVQHVQGHYVWLHVRAVFQHDAAGRRVRSVGFVLDVSHRRGIQQALVESERKFRNLIESSIQGVIIHRAYKPLFCNPAYARMLGYDTVEEVMALDTLTVHLAPDLREESEDFWLQAVTGRLDGKVLRRKVINRAGKVVWFETVGRLIQWDGEPAWQMAVIEVTEQARFEEELRASEEKFRLLADNATDVITLYDGEGTVRYMSPSVFRVTGYTAEESTGRSPFDIVHPDDLPALIAQRQLGGKHGPQGGTALWRLRHRDGRWIWMESRASVIPKQDGTYNILASSRDVTERVEREAELKAARDRLQHQTDELAGLARNLELERERAERANTAKSQFLAMMSHELRTPMTGVIGMADLLLVSGLSDEQKRLTQLLIRSARVLLDLLNDVLDFSKIEAGQLEIEAIPFSISQIVTEVSDMFATTLADKGLRFDASIAPEVQDTVIGDPKRLRQVLANLVNNSAKFTHKGGIAVRLDMSEGTDGSLTLRCAVSDTGIGIAQEDVARLFRPFVQADLSTSRQYGGTGLGLAICKRLVLAMGGDIALESTPGKGSTFTFTIRVAAAPGAVAAADQPALPVLSESPARHLRILMADDNETTRYLIASMLGRLNHTIKAVEDGLQALQAAEAEDFDIVLMDMQMPVMDGLEAAREIRKLSGLRGQVPIIALTADAIPEHRPGFFAAGVNAVVVKPVVWRELGEQIDSLVGGAGVAAGMSRTPSRAELAEIADSVAGGQPVPAADPILNEAILDELSATLGVAAVTNMLPTFVTNMVDYRDRLARAVASGDLEEVKRAAHAMKGLAAQFGAPQVSAIARRIEQEATSIPDVAGVLGALGAAVAATAQAIRGRIERANTRSP